jgi:hypothetical protein
MATKAKSDNRHNVGVVLVFVCGAFAVLAGWLGTGTDFSRGLSIGIGTGAILVGLTLYKYRK